MIKRFIRQVQIFFDFLFDVIRSRKLIFDLTKRDFKVRYLGSYLGVLWAFVQPLFNILIMWFVFEYTFFRGTRSAGAEPFSLYLVTGMIPWNFIIEAVLSGAGSVTDNSFLVKKVVFRVTILPIIKLLSAYIVHLFFVVFIFVVLLIKGYTPSFYWLQIFYYQFAAWILLLGISWITSSVVIFIKDLGQIIGVLMQFMFWLTPVIWYTDNLRKHVTLYKIMQLNPFYYIVNGYRTSLLKHKVFFLSDIPHGLYYWGLTLVIFVVGAIVFKKLRPHFADVM